jgi:integrative and conjugative element protein (TIGR02256 family)
MQFVSSWRSADSRILLDLGARSLEVFAAHVQSSAAAPEAGGLLLGTVHGQGMLISEATTPTRMDRQWRTLFERMPFGHRAIAKRRWRASGGTVRYLGEWHTHPEDHPHPSGTDLVEWRALANKRTDGRAVLAVIVGRRGLHVELMAASGERLQLLPATA